ncbi:S41 family peptidase [Dinghuibacter silviterrae]|nr:S41 family peptidase [Dinghuibacter silviterrae]
MNNNRRIQVWLPLLFALTMIVGMWIGFALSRDMGGSGGGLFSRTGASTSLQEILDLVRNRYVDSVNVPAVTDSAIGTVLDQLDPHSAFIPASELAEVNEDLEGGFEGIGIEFNLLNDTLNVVSVVPGGPSEKAGLMVGDQILKVNDSLLNGRKLTNDLVRKMLKGPEASQVKISVLRQGQPKDFVITRSLVPLNSLDAAYMLEPEVGYIKLNKFSATTYQEFMDAMDSLKKKGMQRLVLDLRDNGGGYMEQAVKIADEFLDDNKLIVYTQGVHSPKKEYKADHPGIFEKGKLVVLVDEGTASASEILTGSLQDWDRATIIGRRSFGKGLVQEQYSLTDGSALRLTIARYYTPLGRCIQKSYAKGIKVYEDDLLNRIHNGELVNADSNKVAVGQVYTTPLGRKVYGGGGIMPDLFVPLDTTEYSPVITRLLRYNTLVDFAYKYYVGHRSAMDQYGSPAAFARDFHTTEALWADLARFAVRDSVQLQYLPARDKDMLLLRTKSLLAHQIWRMEGFYEVYNQDDTMIKKAEEVLK